MAHFAAASRALGFERIFGVLPVGVREKMRLLGLDKCEVWAHFKPLEVVDPDDQREQMRQHNAALELLHELGEGEEAPSPSSHARQSHVRLDKKGNASISQSIRLAWASDNWTPGRRVPLGA